jgi:hypothetical protein
VRLTRQGVLVGLALWLLSVGAFAVWVAGSGVLGCGDLTPGDSNAGEGKWTWTPPGVDCSWPVEGGTHTESPPLGRYFVVWGLAAFPVVLLGAWRMQRSDESSGA